MHRVRFCLGVQIDFLVEKAQAKGIALPDFVVRQLPERIEYTGLGVRAEIRDESLHLFGTHGADHAAILTVRALGRDWSVITEPKEPIELRPAFDRLRACLLADLAQAFRRLEAHQLATRAAAVLE